MSEEKKRTRMYIYGERTENVSIAVPESKKPEVLAKFYEVLKDYHNPQMLSLDPKPKPEKKEIQDGFANTYAIQDEAPNIPSETLKELWKEAAPEIFDGIAVSALPKDKKKISTGLYSAGGKFYTNKIVANQLQILEWNSKESAEEYLSNLK